MTPSRLNPYLPLIALALAAACRPETPIECPKGFTMCGGACQALASDEANCGACGHACALTESCVAGACRADCARQLQMPLTDDWGYSWDGNERPAADLAGAQAACEAIGGRLPTLSELHRVSGAKTAAVADGYRTNVIRALTPTDAVNTMAIRLSDGATSVVANDAQTPYRCVCPPPAPTAFTGSACQGAPGSECFTFDGEPTLAFDSQDRPKAVKSAAIWECAFVGGQLAPAERLVGAVLAGLPSDTRTALHTADQLTTGLEARIAWNDAIWTAAGAGNVIAGAPTDLAPFRCVGPRHATLASADSLDGGVLAPATRAVVDGADHGAGEQLPYADAVGACSTAGGHLPSSAELASVAVQGVPRTESGLLWTGDEAESDNGSFFATIFGWTGTAAWPGVTTATVAGIPFVSPTTVGASAKTAALPYRCLYPAVDASYAGPAASDCNGGCALFESSTGRTGTPARTWMDRTDRAADTLEGATAFCGSLGARVASSRDLVEGIRRGLPGIDGGTPEQVLTGDFAERWVMVTAAWNEQLCRSYSCGFLGLSTCTDCWIVTHPAVYQWAPGHYALPQWSGSTNGTYDDIAGKAVALGTIGRFRCLWTNEIR